MTTPIPTFAGPAPTHPPISAPRRGRNAARWAFALGAVATAGVASVALAPRWRDASHAATRPESAATGSAPHHDPRTTVVLPEGKYKVAGIALESARMDELTTEVGVTGQVTLNVDRRVEIKPRVAGIVREVEATLGKKVKAGETLAVLDSPDVGTARLALRARQRELASARIESDWRREVSGNVEAMIPLLRKGAPAKEIEEAFRGKPLGTYRGEMLGTYADFEIASHEEEKQSSLNKDGLVGEHPVFLTKHTREGKQARFEAALEQARFDATQGARLADQAARSAEAAVIDAAQRLRILGVPEDIHRAIAPGVGSAPGGYEDVTAYPIAAPFEGTIVARSVVPSQRVEPIEPIFTLADTTNVRVTANVPESRVGLLAMGRPVVRFGAEAYPGRTFEGRVIFVGEEVDPKTRTVAILAETPNTEGLLRPGMFVRIVLDAPGTTPSLTVPAGAVVEVDGKPGVFRPGVEPRSYLFHPVALVGPEANGRRRIGSGLAAGDAVVSAGAFALKSELVLQNETGED